MKTKQEEKGIFAHNIDMTAKLLDAGHSYAEIAAILNKPEYIVRSWVRTVTNSRKVR